MMLLVNHRNNPCKKYVNHLKIDNNILFLRLLSNCPLTELYNTLISVVRFQIATTLSKLKLNLNFIFVYVLLV